MPDRVSVVSLIISTNLFPFLAYSIRNIPVNIPIGQEINKDKNVIIKVVIIAGNKETFSVVYSKANREGFICGIPFIKIYPIIINKIEKVKNAESITRVLISLLNLVN